MLLRLRKEAKNKAEKETPPLKGQNAASSGLETAAMKGFTFAASNPSLYHTGTYMATKLQNLIPNNLGAWTQCRTSPKPAKQTLHQIMAKRRKAKNDKQ
jgi:L-lactate dehydrogenase complex protein LldF